MLIEPPGQKERKDSEIQLPDLRGKEIEQALPLLKEKSIDCEVSKQAYHGKKGLVIGQNPLPGSLVDKGSKVTLTVGIPLDEYKTSILHCAEINKGTWDKCAETACDKRNDSVSIRAKGKEIPRIYILLSVSIILLYCTYGFESKGRKR